MQSPPVAEPILQHKIQSLLLTKPNQQWHFIPKPLLNVAGDTFVSQNHKSCKGTKYKKLTLLISF